MNPTTTTTHRYVTPLQVAIVSEKLDALQTRGRKKGLNGSLSYTVETVTLQGDNGDGTHYDITRYDLTLTHEGDFALGEHSPVGVIDFTGADTGLVFAIGDNDLGDIDLDPERCDHCGRKVRRNKVIIVQDENGNRIHVGGTCVKDFLGHDPQWFTWVAEAVEIDEEREPGGTHFDGRYTFAAFMDAAIEANRLGYRPTSFEGSTKQLALIVARGDLGKDYAKADREALEAAPAATVTVAEVKAWMLALDSDSDFDRNMRAIAESNFIGPKAYGTATYAPAGLLRWSEKEAARKAKAAAEADRVADAEPAPVTDKRIRIEGVVTTMRTERNDFGTVEKIRVETDAGWACWGTLPSQIVEAGVSDRISFDARLTVSRDDELFGFFSRPTKGAIVAREAVIA
tara:strand:+ start:60 stop:1259 length:1200 start_codon:yes stop_codon:yes gene_type:complete